MIVPAALEGQRVGVLGFGRSGAATAQALAAAGATPIVFDDGEAGLARAQAAGWRAARPEEIGRGVILDGLVVSPGVPHLFPAPHSVVTATRSLGGWIDNDIGLFFAARAAVPAEVRPKVVAITGTNGKSTTAALFAHALGRLGRPVQLGGNIGRGALDLEPLGGDGVYVLELSSYQTELARRLDADVAILTNFSPDHLDRHGGVGGYLAAKRRLLEASAWRSVGGEGREADFLVAALGRDGVVAVGREGRASALHADGSVTLIREPRLVIELDPAKGLRGVHNAQNAAHVLLGLERLGYAPEAAAAAFDGFAGLPHRLQTVGVVGGVAYVNDSKATNADAAALALSAFHRVRWIAGGVPKEGGLGPAVDQLGRVVKAYLIGQAAAQFQAEIGARAPIELCGDLATAVRRASEEAAADETVLLAPACASFDQFRDFEHRGDVFTELVGRIAETRARADGRS